VHKTVPFASRPFVVQPRQDDFAERGELPAAGIKPRPETVGWIPLFGGANVNLASPMSYYPHLPSSSVVVPASDGRYGSVFFPLTIHPWSL